MKLSYKQRLFLYFAIIFAVFTIGVITFEQSREKKFRTRALEEKLDASAEMIYVALRGNNFQVKALDSLMRLFPQNIRVSVIDRQDLYNSIIPLRIYRGWIIMRGVRKLYRRRKAERVPLPAFRHPIILSICTMRESMATAISALHCPTIPIRNAC